MNTIDTNTAKQVAVATTKASPFTPAMFTPLKVARSIAMTVVPVVAVLHFTIHQSLVADAVEFVLGGAFIAWFYMLLCNPHLVDKIPYGNGSVDDVDDCFIYDTIYSSFRGNIYNDEDD